MSHFIKLSQSNVLEGVRTKVQLLKEFIFWLTTEKQINDKFAVLAYQPQSYSQYVNCTRCNETFSELELFNSLCLRCFAEEFVNSRRKR